MFPGAGVDQVASWRKRGGIDPPTRRNNRGGPGFNQRRELSFRVGSRGFHLLEKRQFGLQLRGNLLVFLALLQLDFLKLFQRRLLLRLGTAGLRSTQLLLGGLEFGFHLGPRRGEFLEGRRTQGARPLFQ